MERRLSKHNWSTNSVIMEDDITLLYQTSKRLAQTSEKHYSTTKKRAALTDITSETLLAHNARITCSCKFSCSCNLQEQSFQRSNTKYSKSVTGAQTSYSSTALSKRLEDQPTCSYTLNSERPSCVFECTPDLLVPDEKYSLDYEYRTLFSKAKQVTPSHIVGQESLACSESIVISTLHNQHFTQLIPYLRSPPDSSPLPYQSHWNLPSSGNLPSYDKPPPDSDIAQLWEEVRSKVTQMVMSNPSLGIPSQSSRQPDINSTKGKIKTLSSWALDNKDPNEYLEMNSNNHNSCVSNMPDEELDFSPDNCLFGYRTVITNVALRCLHNFTKTQISSDSTQQDSPDVAVQAAFLNVMTFISTSSHSEGFDKRIFSLDLRSTLYNKGWPEVSLVPIHPTLMREQVYGPSFLHLHFSLNQASNTILAKWKLDAQEELTNQLRLSRDINESIEEKRNVASRLRHFCYLVEGSKLSIWEMKIQIKPQTIPSSTTAKTSIYSKSSSSSTVSSAPRPFQEEPKRSYQPEPFRLPCDLPCESREIWSFDLHLRTDIRRFCEVNRVIIRWGQVKHGAEYVQSICRLGNRRSYIGWVMSGPEMQLCWKDIVFGQHDKVLVGDKVLA